MTDERRIETSTGCIWLRDDGVLEILYEDGAHLTLEDSKLYVEAMGQLIPGGRPAPLLVDFGGLVSQTSEGRAYFAQSEDARRVASKVALLTKSLVSRVLANSYLAIKRPNIPTRLFTSRDEAIAWLREPSQ